MFPYQIRSLKIYFNSSTRIPTRKGTNKIIYKKKCQNLKRRPQIAIHTENLGGGKVAIKMKSWDNANFQRLSSAYTLVFILGCFFIIIIIILLKGIFSLLTGPTRKSCGVYTLSLSYRKIESHLQSMTVRWISIQRL